MRFNWSPVNCWKILLIRTISSQAFIIKGRFNDYPDAI
nr:MAG TPA: hypothetical protein [Caudoviricetes sp.]